VRYLRLHRQARQRRRTMSGDCTDPLDPIDEFLTPGGAYAIDRMMGTIAKLRAENEQLRDDLKTETEASAAIESMFRTEQTVNDRLRAQIAAAQAQAEASKAEAERLRDEIGMSGKVRCPKCQHVIDLSDSLREVTYIGDVEDVECSECGCEFEAQADDVRISFYAELP
jgi:predicted RNase H-like nuclease (RuvC/YqgF family)